MIFSCPTRVESVVLWSVILGVYTTRCGAWCIYHPRPPGNFQRGQGNLYKDLLLVILYTLSDIYTELLFGRYIHQDLGGAVVQ